MPDDEEVWKALEISLRETDAHICAIEAILVALLRETPGIEPTVRRIFASIVRKRDAMQRAIASARLDELLAQPGHKSPQQ